MSAVPAVSPQKKKKSGQSADEQAGLARKFRYYMGMMREVEDRIERKLYRQGKVLGGVYVGRGQEAIPVGSSILSATDDMLFPSHRDMAVYLIRGVEPKRIFAQYMGRVGGLTQGRDGNMHMGDLKLNIAAIISAMAACVPVATGAALAMKYKGTRNVVFCYFGDGATSRGDWHEGVNFATVQKLPVLYVCNNNQYAYSTPLNLQMACANIADKAPAYGMPAEIVDGNDVLAVLAAARRGLAHVRGGLGPYMLECKTFRMTGHSAHDDAHYVPKQMFEEWSKLDPIVRLEARMMDNGWADQAAIQENRARVRAEVDDGLAWAEQSPYPDPSTLLDDVYETL